MKNLREQLLALDTVGTKASKEHHDKYMKALSPLGWEDTTYRNDCNISMGYGEPDYVTGKIWFIDLTNDEGRTLVATNLIDASMVQQAFDGYEQDEFGFFKSNSVFDKRLITAEDFSDIVRAIFDLDDMYTVNEKIDNVIELLIKTVKNSADIAVSIRD